MKIYTDIISGDELCADTFPMELEDGCVYKVKGKLRTDTIDIDESAIGGNASAEGGDEGGADAASVSGIDVVLNHKLQSCPMSKKDYKEYIKGYMKKIKEKVAESNPDGVKAFEQGMAKFIKKVLGNFDDYEMYMGESYNCDAMVALLNWDGETPYFYFFKEGLVEEKV